MNYMIELTKKQVADYFHRSYTAADGLWFLKIEEKYGFETALEIGNNVWRIMPKIQARMLKEMGNLGNGIDALRESLETKLTLEGFMFTITRNEPGDVLRIILTDCPWFNFMRESNREHLAEKVGNIICHTEFGTWAHEFDGNLDVSITEKLCDGKVRCIITIFQNNRKGCD